MLINEKDDLKAEKDFLTFRSAKKSKKKSNL